MNTNESLWDITQRYLKSEGIEITSWNDPGGYFIFDSEKPLEVVHFKVKGCRGWSFGMWINRAKGTAIEYFMQHDDWLNKFKPNQGCLDGEVRYEDPDKEITYDESMCHPKGEDFGVHDFYRMAKSIMFVKKCPFAAYVMGSKYDFRDTYSLVFKEYLSLKWSCFKENLVLHHLRYIIPYIKAWLNAVWTYITVKDVCGFKIINEDKVNDCVSFPPWLSVQFSYRHQEAGND